MVKNIVVIFFIFLFNFIFSFGYAQQNFTVAGGSALGTQGNASISIGQVFYTTNTNSVFTVSEGVQQPYEIYITGIDESVTSPISLTIFPNPTTQNLTIQLQNIKNESWTYQLLDMQGKLLASDLIIENNTVIETKNLASATYFLKIFNTDKISQSFKIIKN